MRLSLPVSKGPQSNKKLKNLEKLVVRKVGLPPLFLNFF